MTWFKVDDKLHDHRKVRAAGTKAMGVWVLCGSWAADNLTDGFVPESVEKRFGTLREANKLVESSLWEPAELDGEKGWRFTDWKEYQPTRAQVEEIRQRRAEAGHLGGLASGRKRKQI